MNDHQAIESETSIVSPFNIRLILIAWLCMLGFDFFLHGGLLADIYSQESPFLLSPMQSFRRIPIGYLSFLIAAAFLVWLSLKVGIRSAKDGFMLGLSVGLVIWISQSLGLYSITTAKPVTLLAWSIGQSVEMAFAGAIVGIARKDASLRKAFLIALISALLLISLTILAQSIGLVRAPLVL